MDAEKPAPAPIKTLGLVLLAMSTTATANPACHGKLAFLQAYAGSYESQELLSEPDVTRHLENLPVTVLKHLRKNLNVSGPVDLVSCHLVVTGNAVSGGGNEDAIIDIDLFSGAVVAGLHASIRTDVYAADPDYRHLPIAVRDWLAVVADRFLNRVHPPLRMRLLSLPERPIQSMESTHKLRKK